MGDFSAHLIAKTPLTAKSRLSTSLPSRRPDTKKRHGAAHTPTTQPTPQHSPKSLTQHGLNSLHLIPLPHTQVSSGHLKTLLCLSCPLTKMLGPEKEQHFPINLASLYQASFISLVKILRHQMLNLNKNHKAEGFPCYLRPLIL